MHPDLGFPLPPPIKGEWLKLGSVETSLLIARLSETGYFSGDDTPSDLIRVLPLPFYPGWLLCDIATKRRSRKEQGQNEIVSAIGKGVHSFLYGPDGFTALTGSSEPILAHNALHSLDLQTADLVKAYIFFFCFFIRGDEGPFEVVGNDQQLFLAPDENGIKHEAKIEPLSVVGSVSNGQAAAKATIYYGGRLHEVRFSVTPGGQVKMDDDDVIAMGVTRVPALSFSNTLRFETGGAADVDV